MSSLQLLLLYRLPASAGCFVHMNCRCRGNYAEICLKCLFFFFVSEQKLAEPYRDFVVQVMEGTLMAAWNTWYIPIAFQGPLIFR